ncbi:MAG: asparaginase [Candidatus Peribacteraceae bacterium]|nr:asparaginase [Candidatus Peribacteria bacterium]
MPRPNIALLYVGGSIGMKMNQKTGRIEPIESLIEIHRFLPELQREVALKFFSLTNVGSSEVMPEHWAEVARTIESIYDEFDGFVVVHGTNTMSYTAAALSFALQGLSKPIVMTGAILPINDIAGDGRMNLIYAIRTAQLDIAEVCVVLGPQALRGTRIKKVDQSLFRTFDTPSMAPLAQFNSRVHLSPERMVRRKRTMHCHPHFDDNVVLITLHPGMSATYLDAILAARPHGIVLRTFGPGMIPKNLFPWIKKVAHADIPLLITSQALRGKVDLSRYRKQMAFEKLGVISGKNMTYECAIVKLMWALKQSKNLRRIRMLMEENLAGELDP